MTKKMILAFVASVFLMLSAVVQADSVTIVWNCELNDGMTKDDAMATGAKWVKWARTVAGTDEITSSYVTTAVGDYEGFMWVDTFPDLATWAKVAEADAESPDPEIAAEFEALETCSRTRMYNADEAAPAK